MIDGNLHTTCTIYKTFKLYWSNIVDNVEFVGLTNDIFVSDALHLFS